MMPVENMIVTPWEVKGEIDYDKLIEQFGTEPITPELLEKIRRHTGELHLQLRRKIFFSHRDLDWILGRYEGGERFVLYTGRGPSGAVHIGHLLPWIFTRHLQEKFRTRLYFQMTDDEKFLIRPDLTLEKTEYYTKENSLDLIALGFQPGETLIMPDTRCARTFYNMALEIAKHVNFSTGRAVFGFEESSNIGIVFFPAIQAVPCFLESMLTGEKVPALIPAAIDQDPYWRMTRDVAPRLGYPKPAQIHGKFLPSLGRKEKMSASLPETAIYTTDSPETAERKIMNAFTGGRATVEEQRRLGANPEICPIYFYEYFLFVEDDAQIGRIFQDCRSGKLLCGDHKRSLAESVSKFLVRHQELREKARDRLDEYLVDDQFLEMLRR
jgi:tryptophanyl-tRNA synthetase